MSSGREDHEHCERRENRLIDELAEARERYDTLEQSYIEGAKSYAEARAEIERLRAENDLLRQTTVTATVSSMADTLGDLAKSRADAERLATAGDTLAARLARETFTSWSELEAWRKLRGQG